MARLRLAAPIVGLAVIALRCSLVTDLDGLTGGGSDASTVDGGGTDSIAAPDSNSQRDAGTDAGSDAGCDCSGLISAYTFSDASHLGHDSLGNNNMVRVAGAPIQSTVVPAGRGGYSIELDGSSSVCIDSGFTFDSTSDHTLCWWSQPTALSDNTNEFAQDCGYDTWTSSAGVDYQWRINNCNDGGTSNLDVPGVFSTGTWVQICQTYTQATSTRTVVINGNTGAKVSQTDPGPILESPSAPWCIGSYGGGGGFWTGRIYLPMWFDRVLDDAEIADVSAKACCLP